MTEAYQCPFCDYTAGQTGSVKAHITRKTDEAHEGISGPEHGDSIERVSVDSESRSESGETSRDGNPAMSGPSMDTDPQASQEHKGTRTELPCGCETVDLSNADPPVIVECETCGREYPYE